MHLTTRSSNSGVFNPSSFISTIFSLRSLAATAIVAMSSLLMSTGASAQIVTDTTHWNDADLYQEPATAPSFFSVGGGVLGGYFMPKFDKYNANVVTPFAHTTVPERVFMIGGQGFITVPWVKNLRLGGMGYSGTSDCGCFDTTLSGNQVNRYVTYNVGYGALTIDYVLPLRTGRFHIVPGVALGAGSVNIYARQSSNRLNFNIAEFDQPNLFTTHTYNSKFFLYMPQIQFEYSPLGFMMLRLSAGYQGTSMGSWTVDQGIGLGNTTGLDGVNGSGLIFNFGIFFGLFQ